jgi:hypothetical protein
MFKAIIRARTSGENFCASFLQDAAVNIVRLSGTKSNNYTI